MFSNVTIVDNDRLNRWIIQQVRADRLDPAPSPGFALKTVLRRSSRTRLCCEPNEGFARVIEIIRMNPLERRLTKDLLVGKADYSSGSRASVGHYSLSINL